MSEDHPRRGEVDGYRKAPERVIESRRATASAVADALAQAGLPADATLDVSTGGAQIEVDEGDDAAGGVFVTWQTGGIGDRAVVAIASGQLDDPSIAHSGAVTELMGHAMSAILQLAGLTAGPAADDMRPLAIRVEVSETR